MALLREIRKRVRQVAFQALFACLVAYFCYHAVQGDRGILAWRHLQLELTEARILNQKLAAKQTALEQRIALLRPESLDPDLLEERARLMLNYGRPDEVILDPSPSGD